MEKLYAAGAGVLVAERGGHTPLHLACRSGAHGCAQALLQPRPRCPRDFPSTTYLTQASSHTPGSEDIPEAASDSEKEEEECESEEDWKLQLQAENYEGEGPRPHRKAGSHSRRSPLLLWPENQDWIWGTQGPPPEGPDHLGLRSTSYRPRATEILS